jgi:hypothetical protein
MFAASTVAKRSGALRRLPATKKSLLPRTNREIQTPPAVSPTE